jgi:hypothetical protein
MSALAETLCTRMVAERDRCCPHHTFEASDRVVHGSDRDLITGAGTAAATPGQRGADRMADPSVPRLGRPQLFK